MNRLLTSSLIVVAVVCFAFAAHALLFPEPEQVLSVEPAEQTLADATVGQAIEVVFRLRNKTHTVISILGCDEGTGKKSLRVQPKRTIPFDVAAHSAEEWPCEIVPLGKGKVESMVTIYYAFSGQGLRTLTVKVSGITNTAKPKGH